MTKEESHFCEVRGVRLIVKHIVTKCMNEYKQDWQKVKMEEILDITLGPETANNMKMLKFFKISNLYSKI